MGKKYLYSLEENTIVEIQSSRINNYTTKTEIIGEYMFVIKELVKRGIMRKIRVVGKSMVPFLLPGEWVMISNDIDRLNEGDIVVYVRVESLVIHRVKRIRNGRVITRGDNCPVDDSEISVDNVVGVAVKRHINVFLRLLYCVKYFRKKKYKISQHIVTSIFKPVRSTYN